MAILKNNTKNKKPMAKSQKIVFGVAFVFMGLYCLLILFFFLFGFLISVKGGQSDYLDDIINVEVFRWPANFTFKNYLACFTTWKEIDGVHTYMDMLWNSIWRTTLGNLITFGFSTMVCYVLIHYKTPFTDFIYLAGLFFAMLPLYGSSGSSYRLHVRLGLIDSPLILITNVTLYGGSFFFMCAFWRGISHEYIDAASIDGANDYQTMFRVMIPQALPAVAALFVMGFIGGWNDYASTAIYMAKYPNLSYGVYAFSEISRYASNVPGYFAGVLLSLVPILILFACFQNTIMEKMYLGGLKG